jgi:hypothetical protein
LGADLLGEIDKRRCVNGRRRLGAHDRFPGELPAAL